MTLPETLPIALITRFINWFHEFGIPVVGVVVNDLIQKDKAGKDAADFVLNRIQMQDEHMGEIWSIFGDRVRVIVPFFETEVKGATMLQRTVYGSQAKCMATGDSRSTSRPSPITPRPWSGRSSRWRQVVPSP